MIVVGENLRSLILQKSICPENLFDEFSIVLNLDNVVYHPRADRQNEVVSYNRQDTSGFYQREELTTGILILKPRCPVLACSTNEIHMPTGYFGLLQTKGSLARLFVTVHSGDSQIEPGFKGKITFEMCCNAPFQVSVSVGDPVAQLFIMRCGTGISGEYSGRYQNAQEPTISLPRLGR